MALKAKEKNKLKRESLAVLSRQSAEKSVSRLLKVDVHA